MKPKRLLAQPVNHPSGASVSGQIRIWKWVKKLYYIEGARLLGEDGEAATDGSHPSDLGFKRQADVFEPVLREALKN